MVTTSFQDPARVGVPVEGSWPTAAKEAVRAPPVIDLRQDEAELVSQVKEACRTWGFFQITNHGVSTEIRTEFEEQMCAFFGMDEATKLFSERSADNARGYVKMEMTKGQIDNKECYDVGNMVDWDAPENDPVNSGLNGVNRFPNDETLPGFRETIRRYFAEMDRVARWVSELMALGMGVKRTYFRDAMASAHTSHLRLNHYPETSKERTSYGVGPHTDAGFLTVLAQDMKVQTLQVKHRDTDEWIPVRPVDGSFTINTGDLAHIFSNGIYHAPEHRVLSYSKERFSAPYFYNPSYESTIEPVPAMVNVATPSQFWPMTWGYFRSQRVMNNFGNSGEYVKAEMWRRRPGGEKPKHVMLQDMFTELIDYRVPFNIYEYQDKLQKVVLANE